MTTEFFIDGRLQHATAKRYSIFAPHDGSEIAVIPDASGEDVEAAVAAAKRAFNGGWRDFEPEERAELLWKWAQAVEDRGAELGALDGLETGRTTVGANMQFSARYIRYFAGLIGKLYGSVLTAEDTLLNYLIKQPLGVVAAMPPWNTVVGGAIQKIAPAIAAGNTVVLRAPDDAPLSCLALAQTFVDAGFPPGVVNVVAGSGPLVGKALVAHPDVRLVSFTGSVEVGKKIMAAAAQTMTRTILELGGKSPFVIFADADLDKAVETAVACGFGFQGQVCSAVSRVLVERSLVDEVVGRMKLLTDAYRPALPDDAGDDPTIGPLFSEKQLARVERYVEAGRNEGRLVTGGERIVEKPFDSACYYRPTIFEFDESGSSVTREEIFGPVISVIPFDTAEAAVEIANDVPYGLSASVWSKDIGKVLYCSRRIEAGTIWANGYYQYSNHSPWGGVKESGHGKEFGVDAIEPYTEHKSVWINQ